MAVKQVSHYREIEDKILRAVETITDPIRQTLGPRGGNVIFENSQGEVSSTNDGVTIAKEITVKDAFEDAIIQVIKQSALKTNTQAGDGTSTTILLSSILIKEGLKLIKDGMNQRDITEAYREFVRVMHEQLAKLKMEVKDDGDLLAITRISANNDEAIAKDTVQIVRVAGEDGYIFLEPSNTKETELKMDTGFVVDAGVLVRELLQQGQSESTFIEVPVLITDKRLYYAQEAETILNTCLKNGHRQVVIVAKDFIGEALPFFVTNHQKGVIRCLLVKDPNVDKSGGATLGDLAAYLNGEVVSDKAGKIVDSLTMKNFCFADKVYADAAQTVIMRSTKLDRKRLDDSVRHIKQEIKKLGDEDTDEKKLLKKRLASLTNGVVTVRIGGSTPIEVNEKRFRFEDAISAGRAAMKYGYLIGGGMSVLNAFKKAKFKNTPPELINIFKKVSEANLRQIAENAGAHPDSVVENVSTWDEGYGYDALSKTYVDMKEAGIFDPYRVTEMALENAVSIANAIIGSRYMVVNERDYGKDRNDR